MLSTDVGVAGAPSRYSAGVSSSLSARRENTAADADPFGTMVDRYADADDNQQPLHGRAAAAPRREQAAPARRDALASTPPESSGSATTATVARATRGADRRDDSDANDEASARRSAATHQADDAASNATVTVTTPAAVTAAPSAVAAATESSEAGGTQAVAGGTAAADVKMSTLSDQPGASIAPMLAQLEGKAADAEAAQDDGVPAPAQLLAAIRAAQQQNADGAVQPNVVGAAASSVAGAAAAPARSQAVNRAGEQDAPRRAAIAAIRDALAGKPAKSIDAAAGNSAVAAADVRVGDAKSTSVGADAQTEPVDVAKARPVGAVGSTGGNGVVAGKGSSVATSTASADLASTAVTSQTSDGVASAATVNNASARQAGSSIAAADRADGGNGLASVRAARAAASDQRSGAAVHTSVAQSGDVDAHAVGAVAGASAKGHGNEAQPELPPPTTARAAQAIAAFQAVSAVGSNSVNVASTPQVVAVNDVPGAFLDAELPTQIVHAIRVQFDNGIGEARLRLNPGFLGGLTVGVQMDGSSVVASLHASDPQVREWIRNNEAMLRQSLSDQGFHLERLTVVDDEPQASRDDERQRQDKQDSQEQQRRPRRTSVDSTFELVL